MRTLSASAGHFQEKEWMLPETRELLERQEERKRRLLSGLYMIRYTEHCSVGPTKLIETTTIARTTTIASTTTWMRMKKFMDF